MTGDLNTDNSLWERVKEYFRFVALTGYSSKQ
jgi:hypothetical protein